MKLNAKRIALGILAAALCSVLGLAAIIALVILFGAAESVADVMGVSRFAVATSIMMGLAAAWGAVIALRPLATGHLAHGFCIGLGVGLLHLLLVPTPPVGHLLALLLALPAGIFGARIAQLSPLSDSSPRSS